MNKVRESIEGLTIHRKVVRGLIGIIAFSGLLAFLLRFDLRMPPGIWASGLPHSPSKQSWRANDRRQLGKITVRVKRPGGLDYTVKHPEITPDREMNDCSSLSELVAQL
jgi:hypothetical protein